MYRYEHQDTTEQLDVGNSDTQTDWKDAILSLIVSRIAIIRIESKDAIASAVSKVIAVVIALFFLLLVWLLLLTGAIGAIAAKSGWYWYDVTFVAAGVHALVVLIALAFCRTKKTRVGFPITKAEFEKDLEWLNELKNERNSPS